MLNGNKAEFVEHRVKSRQEFKADELKIYLFVECLGKLNVNSSKTCFKFLYNG
jgi:hypothetical protein